MSGRVVQDHSGLAAPSVQVKISQPGAAYLAADLESDGEGKFEADGLPAGEYRVQLLKPGHITTQTRVTLREDQPLSITLRIVRGGSISGQVTDSAGRPVAGIRVLAMLKEAGVWKQVRAVPGALATTDPAGAYRLFNLPPGEYQVAASYGASPFEVGSRGQAPARTALGTGFQLYPETHTISGGEEHRGANLTITPGLTFRISGRVEGSSAKERYWVTLTPARQSGLAAAVMPAQDDGSFRIEGIAPGEYDLFANGPVRGYGGSGAFLHEENRRFARTRVQIAAEDVENVVLVPQSPSALSIKLAVEEGARKVCPPSVRVTLTSIEDAAANTGGTTSVTEATEAVVKNLAPLRYEVAASDLGPGCYQAERLVADLSSTPFGPAVLKLAPAGQIQGKVTGITGQRPGGEVSVILLLAAAGATQSPMVVTAEADGGFAFPGLAPGTYRVLAQRDADPRRAGWYTAARRAAEVVVVGGSTTRIELPLSTLPER